MNAIAPADTALVLCADDYALHADVNAAILRLARAQRLSATSVMALSPRWAQDASALREVGSLIDVGLHLDWTSEWAQAAGWGGSVGAMMLRSSTVGLRASAVHAQVRAVLHRQFDAFEAHWQRAPDHVDGHQHVHQFALLREPLLAVLQERYGDGPVQRRPWLRVSQVAQAGLKARVISAFGASPLQRQAKRLSWPCIGPLVGVYDFDAREGVYAQHMAQWLQQLPASALMMCHPAQATGDTDSAIQADPIHAARLREGAYLQSEAFADALNEAKVRLVRGSTWLASARATA